MTNTKLLPILFVACLAATGCTGTPSSLSGGPSQATANQLRALGKAYHAFHLENKKGPENWDEVIAYGDAESISALRDAGCLVAWGTGFRDISVGTGEFILAYPKSNLESEGYVLLLDGSVLYSKPDGLRTALEGQAKDGLPK